MPSAPPTTPCSTRWPPSNADLIAGIKRQRENADYNPNVTFVQNQVITWIDRAQQAIINFNAASPQERAMVAVATLASQR